MTRTRIAFVINARVTIQSVLHFHSDVSDLMTQSYTLRAIDALCRLWWTIRGSAAVQLVSRHLSNDTGE